MIMKIEEFERRMIKQDVLVRNLTKYIDLPDDVLVVYNGKKAAPMSCRINPYYGQIVHFCSIFYVKEKQYDNCIVEELEPEDKENSHEN